MAKKSSLPAGCYVQNFWMLADLESMKGYIHPIKKIVFFVAGLVGCFFSVSNASMNLTGNWAYQDSKTGVEDLSENYSASFNKKVDLTEIMALDVGMRVNYSSREAGTNKIYSPSLGYQLANDIFTFNLSGYANQTQNSSSSDILSRNVAALWSSSWKANDWIPSLSLNHHRSWQEDDLDVHGVAIDSLSSSGSLNWDFDHSKLYYNYTTQESNNLVRKTQFASIGHNARFSTSANFWKQQGGLSFSSQYSHSSSENSLPVYGEIASLKLNVSAYFAEVTGTSFSLVSSSNLSNSILNDTVIVTDNNMIDFLTIAVRTNPSQQAHKVYLYIDSDDTLLGVDAAKFSWDVYSSNNNSLWTLRQSGASFRYNSTEKRFEIDINGFSDDYVAVRATSDAGSIIVNFSEVEVFQEISASGNRALLETDQTTITNDLDVTLQVRPNLQFTSSLSLLHSEYSEGADYRQVDLSSGLTWEPQEYLNVRLNSSILSRKSDGADEYQDRNYGMSVAFPPMKTIDTIFSVTIKEQYRESEKVSVISNYNVQALAEVYTDLDASLSTTYTSNDDRAEGTTTGTLSSDLNFTARLIPGLVGKLSGRYSKSSGQPVTFGSDTDLIWRISNIVSLRSGYRQIWAASGDSSSMNLNVHIALTRNMQLSFNHRYLIQPDYQSDSSMDWHWTINKYLSMVISGTYRIDDIDDDDWSFASRLNASFSTM